MTPLQPNVIPIKAEILANWNNRNVEAINGPDGFTSSSQCKNY